MSFCSAAGGTCIGDGNDNSVTSAPSTMAAIDDHIVTGSGDDLITTADAKLSAHLAVNAGAGSDTVEVIDDGSIVDGDLAQLSGLEILKLSGDATDNGQSVIFAANAETAGFTRIDASTAGPDDVITIDASGFENALQVDTGAGDDVITLGSGGSVVHAGNGANTVTVGAANDVSHDDAITTGNGADRVLITDGQFSADLTLNLGGGIDRLQVSDDAAVTDADFGGVASLEILKPWSPMRWTTPRA